MANEKRLIWDEDAKRHLIALATGHHSEMLHIDMILNAILHHVPTVDAVEVVRCKGCKHGLEDHKDAYLCDYPCNGLIGFTRGDDFCSYGERRDGE